MATPHRPGPSRLRFMTDRQLAATPNPSARGSPVDTICWGLRRRWLLRQNCPPPPLAGPPPARGSPAELDLMWSPARTRREVSTADACCTSSPPTSLLGVVEETEVLGGRRWRTIRGSGVDWRGICQRTSLPRSATLLGGLRSYLVDDEDLWWWGIHAADGDRSARRIIVCAAPGSKTFQLLEIIHQSTKPGMLPNAMVVANDLDVQRCNLLIHYTKRMCTANLIVTNHEAQNFPGCSLAKFCPETRVDEAKPQNLEFDRILCDVPCSVDGTTRKDPDIWRTWNIGMGNGLHRLQVEIAMRGIGLLKVGGRMVYSTCSMKPVENEAVVGEVYSDSE